MISPPSSGPALCPWGGGLRARMLRQRALLTPCDLLQLNNSYSFTINVSSLPLPDVEELKPRPHQTGGEEHQVYKLLISYHKAR